MRNLVILTGPTAVGKSELSIKLAKAINGEIISADCMQVYKYMDIGTAKISKEEMDNVPHHLIDCIDPTEGFNVYTFKKMAEDAMDEIYSKGKTPIICGGTGFYIQALLYDIHFEETESTTDIREKWEKYANDNGLLALHNKLKEIDPESAELIPQENKKRVIRALEYYEQTGEKISVHNKIERQRTSPYNFTYFVLNDDRSKLYDRINLRVDKMFQNGLVDEVKNLKSMGYCKGLTSMDGIGYKEILDALDGQTTIEEAREIIKQSSRRYAKRQLTWFRREKEVIWLDKSNLSDDDILNFMLDTLKMKGIIN